LIGGNSDLTAGYGCDENRPLSFGKMKNKSFLVDKLYQNG